MGMYVIIIIYQGLKRGVWDSKSTKCLHIGQTQDHNTVQGHCLQTVLTCCLSG